MDDERTGTEEILPGSTKPAVGDFEDEEEAAWG